MSTDNARQDAGQPGNASRPRIIAGFGRSGTTWLQDVLAESNGLRPIFEPLHPRHNKEAREFAHRHYAVDELDPKLYRFLERYFTGDCDSLWTDYRIVTQKLNPMRAELTSAKGIKYFLRSYLRAKDNFLRYRPYRRNEQRIVKFIRANMMLSWIQHAFDARIVFIVRHPAAVVMSQLRAAKFWDPFHNIERYRQDQGLLRVLDRQTAQLLSRKLDRVEAYALSWCIENSVALRQCEASGILVVHYEDLVRNGLPEWKRIVAALELPTEPGSGLVSQPSQQTWGKRAESTELVSKYWSWADKADRDTLDRIQSMLDATGTSIYRVSDVLPAGSEPR